MIITSVIPFVLPGLAVREAVFKETELRISVESTEASAKCPKCDAASIRRHSSYQRSVQGTPVGLTTVQLQVRVRRFRCDYHHCAQKTFAEQYPQLVGRRRRRTNLEPPDVWESKLRFAAITRFARRSMTAALLATKNHDC